MTVIPEEVRTERLLLRRMTWADRTAAVEILGDPDTNRHNSAGPASPEVAAALLGQWIEHWQEHGFGYWTVTLTETGETVGFGGVRSLEFEGETALNVFYRFRPSAWGRGYASEMARAAVDCAVRALSERPLLILTAVANGQAVRVAEKLGFHKSHETDYEGDRCAVYRCQPSTMVT